MNSKHTLLILGAFLLLFGSTHAFSFDSSIATNEVISVSSVIPNHPLLVAIDGPLVVSVKPIFPPTLDNSPSSVFYPSSGLNGGQRTGLTEDDLGVILSSTRRYNHSTNQWETFTWSPVQRENLITSWIASNDRVSSSRDLGSEMYYNSEKPVQSKRLVRSKWKSFREQFLKESD